MSGARRCVVYAALAVICAGSLVDLATDREHWPFSQYAMYSEVKREPYELRQLRLFGVPARGEEFALRQVEYIQPFDQVRLRLILSEFRVDPRRRPLLATALQDCLTRYETLRRAGRHSGPPLAGVRLYELHWRLDPWAHNADRPDSRTLVLEVPRPQREPMM
jgi:hypothetical protein